MKLLFLLLIFAVPASAQFISDSIKVGSHYRTFHFNKPNRSINDGSLIFILHGSGGNGRQAMASAVSLEAIREKENFMAVYPDGYKNFWNECRKAAESAANIENIDEEHFFEEMINYFNKKYGISKKKVFVIGTSGGGHMAYKLALTIPEKITAISALIANLPDTNNFDCIPVGKPVPVMIVNGTADATNPYNGGLMSTGNVNLGHVRSTDSTVAYWATLAGYNKSPVAETITDADPTDGKTIERFRYSKKGLPDVWLYKVIGGKHDYPNDINVFLESWNFFKRQLKQKRE
jgi:polyhydroxybutyrate depolymerase